MNIFKTEAYDPFIDYIKGVAIICVILTHNLPDLAKEYVLFDLWGGMAVPVFLLIQVFHATRYLDDERHTLRDYYNLKKLFKRIILPFCALLSIQVLILCLGAKFGIAKAQEIIINGGLGPGSYYVWVYLQFWLVAPLFIKVFKKCRGVWFEFACIMAAVLLEVISSLIDMPQFVYRLSFVRYFFILFLGVHLYYGTSKISRWRYVLAVAGLAFLIMQSLFDLNLEPALFYGGWNVYHFPTYYYVTFLLLPLIKQLPFKSSWLESVGRYSYEIFLLQMFVFTFFGVALTRFGQLAGVDNKYLLAIINLVGTTSLSIFPVLWYKKRGK